MLEKRIRRLNNQPVDSSGSYVLYWTQTGLRLEENYSLTFALNYADKLKKPLLVFFGLKKFPWSNRRQYQFLMEGILEFKNNLEKIGANFLVKKIDDFYKVIYEAKKACCVISDFGYLKNQRFWRKKISQAISVAFFEVENNVVVPVTLLSSKRINFAFQFRKKIFPVFLHFLKEFKLPTLKNKTKIVGQTAEEIKNLFKTLKIDEKVRPARFTGGESQANIFLKNFIENRLPYYKKYRSDPSKNFQSDLSPYLHFGFISPVKIIKEILKAYSLKDENVLSFLNELLVWRELSRNFTYFEENYDNWKSLPKWAIETLDFHKKDKREYLYSLEQLENAKTHDKYWNAAQKEMILTGKMHNYMRMYWAKKVIEWTSDFRKAFEWLVYLNDKYELDGRDPNGYASISWCFGQFDHPWQERPIFGKVRYMSDKGLERKFNMSLYLERIENLEKNSTVNNKR